MPDLPSGTVTLLFTDIEGSTKLLHELGEAYADVLAEHRRLLREAFAAHGGVEVDTQGDAFFYAFEKAADAVAAADEAQRGLSAGPVAVRMGVHTGEPIVTEEGYVGIDVHTAARIMGAGHGGQVLLSETTRAALNASDNLSLSDLGEHRLRDLEHPVWIFQLGSETFPPLKTISNTNLPRPASSFVGRGRELEEVLALLREPGVRLLTLTGPGGSGKTRLAIEAAGELVGEYPNGVFWVGLAALRDPALVTDTIAQTLGAKGGLDAHIGERELLLLLDNLEQVIAAAPELAALLESCPNLRVLVTSRGLLRVRGEVDFHVPPLVEAEAVSLFCERARLEPSVEIAELCRRLDNLPLAVELAAARTRALTPVQILERLSQRLDLLKGGRDADPRQETLRATIEWSYDLLSREEQQLFRRLSVFAGGCTLEAAEQVADADLETLQSLVENSLVRHTDGRYWLLETIREYAFGQAVQWMEGDELRTRHAAYFRDFAAGRVDGTRAGDVSIHRAMESEQGNFRVALESSLATEAAETGLSLIASLWYFWLTKGYGPEGYEWASRFAPLSGRLDPRARISAIHGASEIARFVGDLNWAEELKNVVVETSREIGYDRGLGMELRDLSQIAVARGDLPRARVLADEALAVFERIGDDDGIGHAIAGVAYVEFAAGDFAAARKRYEESRAIFERTSQPGEVMGDRLMIGECRRREGDLAGAATDLGAVLELAVELNDKAVLPELLQEIAVIAEARANPEGAATLLGASDRLYEEMRFPIWDRGDRDRTIAAARRALGEEKFDAARARGAGMVDEEAIEIAHGALD
jgi:predicted ATPase